MRGVPSNEGAKEEHPLKDVILPLLAMSKLKMAANRHRNALATSFLGLSSLMTLIDLEP